MSDGRWSGGTHNREWSRPGSRHYRERLTPAQTRALYESVCLERFLCETCGSHHPLHEHRQCRINYERGITG